MGAKRHFSEDIPRWFVAHGPVCPISAATRLPRLATSFGLDTLSVRPLSRDAPEGCQGPSVQRLPPNPYPDSLPPVLSSLEFGTGSHPTSSRDSSVHAGRARFGGTARFRASCSLACLVAIVTSDASVAVPARDPGLSAERSFAGPAEDDFFPRRRESRRVVSVTRDAFHRSRFERLPPCGGCPLARTSRTPSIAEVRPLDRRRLLSPAPARAHPSCEACARGVPAKASPCP